MTERFLTKRIDRAESERPRRTSSWTAADKLVERKGFAVSTRQDDSESPKRPDILWWMNCHLDSHKLNVYLADHPHKLPAYRIPHLDTSPLWAAESYYDNVGFGLPPQISLLPRSTRHQTHPLTHTHTLTHTYIHTHIHSHTYYIHTHPLTHSHTHTHPITHTHTHTYDHSDMMCGSEFLTWWGVNLRPSLSPTSLQ